MAFTATINSIAPSADSTGIGIVWAVSVTFTDSASGFTSTKFYNFTPTTTISQARTSIIADGTALKAALATAGSLQANVGAVLTI